MQNKNSPNREGFYFGNFVLPVISKKNRENVGAILIARNFFKVSIFYWIVTIMADYFNYTIEKILILLYNNIRKYGGNYG